MLNSMCNQAAFPFGIKNTCAKIQTRFEVRLKREFSKTPSQAPTASKNASWADLIGTMFYTGSARKTWFCVAKVLFLITLGVFDSFEWKNKEIMSFFKIMNFLMSGNSKACGQLTVNKTSNSPRL